MRGRNQFQGRAPKCRDCGSASCHVVLAVPGDPEHGHVWLCGSCDLLRSQPDAKLGKMPDLPIRRAGRKQKERLFDV